MRTKTEFAPPKIDTEEIGTEWRPSRQYAITHVPAFVAAGDVVADARGAEQ
jgi:hypothetical protein